jgi:cytoskeleton protein RodZ
MNSIGARLRQERIRQGYDLQRVSELTKINTNMLEAIEADDLEKLPGIFFTRSFVKQYARALGLTESEFEPELDRLAGCEEVPTLENRPTRREDFDVPPVAAIGSRASAPRSLASLAAFIAILALCSAIYWLWQKARQPAPVAPVAPVSAPAAKPAPPPPPPTAPIEVKIRAIQSAWVRVDVDGKEDFSGILGPNQTRDVQANRLVQLKTGNAAGIEVLWNGRPVGSIGTEGQVRNVEFTPAGFKILPALPPAPAPPAEP